jgi:hypothetical protein
MPSLDHNLPDLLSRSISHWLGAIDSGVLNISTQILGILRTNDFQSHSVASDGDAGMNDLQYAFFNPYTHINGGLDSICGCLKRHENG